MNTIRSRVRILASLIAVLVTMSTPTHAESVDDLSHQAFLGNLHEVRRLLAAGIDPRELDLQGYAPLYNAVLGVAFSPDGNHLEVARALLAAGADLEQRNSNGRTVLEMAQTAAERLGRDQYRALFAVFEGRNGDANGAREQGSGGWIAVAVGFKDDNYDSEMVWAGAWNYPSRQEVVEVVVDLCTKRGGHHCDEGVMVERGGCFAVGSYETRATYDKGGYEYTRFWAEHAMSRGEARRRVEEYGTAEVERVICSK